MHASGFSDATEIVAGEVDQHHMLRVLFGVGEQLLLETSVFGIVLGARPGARDRTQLRVSTGELHQRFGGGADHGDVAEREVVHVGRGIDEPQRTIGVEGIDRMPATETDRQHELIDIARGDVFFGSRDA